MVFTSLRKAGWDIFRYDKTLRAGEDTASLLLLFIIKKSYIDL